MTIKINGHEVKAGDVWVWKNSTTQNPREVTIIHVDERRLSPIVVAFEHAGVAETSPSNGNLVKPKPKTRKVMVPEIKVFKLLSNPDIIWAHSTNVGYLGRDEINSVIHTIPAHEIEVEDV